VNAGAATTRIRAIVCRTCLGDHGKCSHRVTSFIVTTEQEENLLVIARAVLAAALRQP
jgi:hypothetical protein